MISGSSIYLVPFLHNFSGIVSSSTSYWFFKLGGFIQGLMKFREFSLRDVLSLKFSAPFSSETMSDQAF